MSGSTHPYYLHCFQYVVIAVTFLLAVLQKRQEVFSVIGIMHTEQVLHLLRHLLECYGTFQCPRFPYQRVQIVVDVKMPGPFVIASFMSGQFLMVCVIDVQFFTIELYSNGLSDKAVRNGVMTALDADCGLFINRACHHIKASEVTGKVQHGVNVPSQCFWFLSCGYTSRFSVDTFTNARKPLLGSLHGVKVYPGGECTAADIVHATLHVSFLPSGACIAKTEIKAVEGTHTGKGIRRLLTVRFQYHGHLHVVIHHRMRYTMHIMKEIAV